MRTKTDHSNTTNILRAVILVIAACVIHGVMQGIHDNYGIMMRGLIQSTGISYAFLSFCIGVGALLYGLAQPFLGILALRKSNAFVILLGIAGTAAGLVVTPLCRSHVTILLFFGILLPLGTTGLCFGIVMGAITPFLDEKQAAIVSGIVQASAGVGDALMSPALQRLSDNFGIRFAMTSFAVPFIVMIPIAVWLGVMNREQEESLLEQISSETESNNISGAKKDVSETDLRETAVHEMKKTQTAEDYKLIPMLKSAFRNRNYRLILLGFSTCGFNMSIIESHLYSQYVTGGIPNSIASLTLTVYGVATMIGAIATGYLGTRFQMKNVLGTTYALRIVISIIMIAIPISAPLAFLVSAMLGLCGDATVPPTTGMISRQFGAKKMAVLYGFAVIGHQVGAFLSAYLGGVFVSHHMGYTPLWVVNLCLATLAATASYRIRE